MGDTEARRKELDGEECFGCECGIECGIECERPHARRGKLPLVKGREIRFQKGTVKIQRVIRSFSNRVN